MSGKKKLTAKRYVEAAKRLYNRDGEIEIDAGARVSCSDFGAYVHAWVWVDNSEIENND